MLIFVSEGMHSITVHTFKMLQNGGKPMSHIQKDVENAVKMLLAASWLGLKQIIFTLGVISVNWNKYLKT